MASDGRFGIEVWKSWEKSGKNEILKTLKTLIKDEERTPLLTKSGKITTISRIIYDLLAFGIQGLMKKDCVILALQEITNLHPDLPSIILDVASVLDAETSDGASNSSEERANFAFILKEAERFMSDRLLKERLEIDTLQDIGTLKNKNFYTKFIKIKTKLYYKQRKFNLFREESEGYAKLIVELNQDFPEGTDWRNILKIIKSLIGCFNLDPNRVLDLIIEAMEVRPSAHGILTPLLAGYQATGANSDGGSRAVADLLWFKLSTVPSQIVAPSSPPPLMCVVAVLLQGGIVHFDDIYPWLLPEDTTWQKSEEQQAHAANEVVRQLNKVSTRGQEEGAAAPNTPGGQSNGATTTTSSNTTDTFNPDDGAPNDWWNNQKICLAWACATEGWWEGVKSLLARVTKEGSFLPHSLLSPRPVARAVARLIHAMIEPVYRRECPKEGMRVQPMIILGVSGVASIAELQQTVIPAIVALGPALHHDPVLTVKIIRLLIAARKTPGDPLRCDILTVIDTTLLPTLTLMDGNCCLAEEMYTLLKLYPYHTRYCLYERWKNDATLRHPVLQRRRGATLNRAKAAMKRVSKENVKPQGRLIGKLSHSAPGYIFDYMLLQIQLFDNLIGPVVESLKYLTSLSYDVLGFCLVEALEQGNAAFSWGGEASPRLQALCHFSGAAFKKYNIELTGLLQYVANKLKARQSQELLILKEIIQKMAGIEAVEDTTIEQLEATAGGELLRSEAGYFASVRNTRRSSQRLKDAVARNGLDSSLCLLAAQHRRAAVWKAAPRTPLAHNAYHIKLVGREVDRCQDALVQLGTFLAAVYSPEDYSARMPSIEEMVRDYHVGAEVAFFLARPMLSTAGDNSAKAEALAGAVVPLLPPRVWEDISPEFYVTFWSLTMYDLRVPTEAYSREITRLRALAASQVEGSGAAGERARREAERHTSLADRLEEEGKKQCEHVAATRARLAAAGARWFPPRQAKSAKNETVTRLMQLCLFPRALATPADALYCAELVRTLHALKTPNFSTLLCYDRLFCDVTYSVTSCTEGEAHRYGRFLQAVLATAMRWHSDKEAFRKECAHFPGFVTKFRVSNQFSEADDHVGYENYRHVCHKWHYKITKAMVVCLDSGDYVQIRNALIVLKRLLPFFPVLAKLSQIIERKVDKVKDEEKNRRQDISVLALSYGGLLKVRQPHLICEADFHQVAEKASAPPSTNVNINNANMNNTQNSARPDDKNDRDKDVKKEASVITIKKDGSRNERDKPKDESRRKDKSPRERDRNREFKDERYLESVSPEGRSSDGGGAPLSLMSTTISMPPHNRHEDSDRDTKRRKVDASGIKEERSPEGKDKRNKNKGRVEERKERKPSRKRERAEESLLLEQKRRREELKAAKLAHQNGENDDHHIEKHHHKREKSPYSDRAHERPETREKHRRNEGKPRR